MLIQNLKDIGTLIKKTRHKNYISGAELARKTGIGQPAISRIEHGLTNLTLLSLIKISKAFGKKIYITIK